MKYVVAVTKGELSRKVPLIMPNQFVHAEMFKILKQMIRESFDEDCEIFSAGEISFFGPSIVCSGKSSTLGVCSHPDDAELIKCYDYTMGVDIGGVSFSSIVNKAGAVVALTSDSIVELADGQFRKVGDLMEGHVIKVGDSFGVITVLD
jgi:hypothetical protein